eukprot:Platyproteum_vivax@DN7330_c0_g1_i4.p1
MLQKETLKREASSSNTDHSLKITEANYNWSKVAVASECWPIFCGNRLSSVFDCSTSSCVNPTECACNASSVAAGPDISFLSFREVRLTRSPLHSVQGLNR